VAAGQTPGGFVVYAGDLGFSVRTLRGARVGARARARARVGVGARVRVRVRVRV
jgi:hypothetical protein